MRTAEQKLSPTSVVVDNDPHQKYEKNSFLKKVINFFLTPILNSLPAYFNVVVRKTSKDADKVIKTATSHHAIEILYNYHPQKIKNGIERFFYYIWFNLNNPKAVRNRLKLVTREVKTAIQTFDRNNKDINILSIASGSARAIVDALLSIETVEHLNLRDNNLHVTFLDKNPHACGYSKYLIEQQHWGGKYFFRWITDTASSFPSHFAKNGWDKPDIVEMVGLLDYFIDEQVEKIFSVIYENMTQNGILITANIADNNERPFVTRVIGWKMIYRSPEQFTRLMVRAGFKPEQIRIIYEPLKIHFVAIAKK